jgi:hypothetical protein
MQIIQIQESWHFFEELEMICEENFYHSGFFFFLKREIVEKIECV